MEALNHGFVIGIDIFIPEDLRQRTDKYENLAKRIVLIDGSSTDELVLSKAKILQAILKMFMCTLILIILMIMSMKN